MLNRTPRAAVGVRTVLLGLTTLLVAVAATMPAHAGSVVLLSRDSSISAAAGDTVNMSDGSQGFDGFSNVVDTAGAGDPATPRLTANQHSQPALDANSAFTGAFAEGSASADGSGATSSDPAKSEAESVFGLTFQILNVPSLVSFGGSVGVSGGGSTSVELSNQSTGQVLLSKELNGDDGQSIQHSELLNPGVYSLSVNAAVDGKVAGDDGMAYFSVNLSIAPANNETDGGGGPKPVPLPAALWSAATTLLGAGGVVRFARRRQSNATSAVSN